MSEDMVETPQWMLLLENKKKRPHRLAHEIGAGAPCLSCRDSCPGLDLHFWRKLCRNCRCKKEEHDVKDDDGYEQFEILFATSGARKKKRIGAFLNINSPSSTGSLSSASSVGNNNGVTFDWIPPDIPEELAAEYMQQLPASKLPISGSDGALYRRQQLENQIPLHDLDASKCHGLSEDEVRELQQYLENLKNNVVGQGRVTKLPVLYSEQRLPVQGPSQHQSVTTAHASVTGESRPIRIALSQSAHSLKSLSLLPLPKSFTVPHHGQDDLPGLPPPSPELDLPREGNIGLKTPSAFLPSAFQETLHSINPVDPVQKTSKHNSSSNLEQTEKRHKPGIQSLSYIRNTGPNSNMDSQSSLTCMSEEQKKVKSFVPATDGTLISDQQTRDVAFSTEIPVGLESQHSTVLNIPKDYFGTVAGHENLPHANKMTNNQVFGKNTLPASLHHEVPGTQYGFQPVAQDGKFYTVQNPASITHSTTIEGGQAQYYDVQYTGGTGVTPLQDGIVSMLKLPANIVYSTPVPGEKSSIHSVNPDSRNAISSQDAIQSVNADNWSDISSQDARFVPYAPNVSGKLVHSEPVAGDSMPKSAHVLYQSHLVQQDEWRPETMDNELLGKLHQLKVTGLSDGAFQQKESNLECHKCKEKLLPGQVAVLAERAGKQAAWHPQCFVCCTCQELLVDLIYFYHKGEIYCGRHYAGLLDIPRCLACDELIFVKEYTCAEGKTFHVKHFCCYECDTPLGGKHYIPKDDQPVCLECFEKKYGKSCHTCKRKIAPGDQRVGWKDLSWHMSPSCFCCSNCLTSLLGNKFLVKNEQPFCSKGCAQAALCSSTQ